MGVKWAFMALHYVPHDDVSCDREAQKVAIAKGVWHELNREVKKQREPQKVEVTEGATGLLVLGYLAREMYVKYSEMLCTP